MFSNATEAMVWQEHNCYRCWKYKADSINENRHDRDKMRCKKGFDIDLGYITGELPEKTKSIIENFDCPYRQEKRPIYKKHDGSMPLFEGA